MIEKTFHFAFIVLIYVTILLPTILFAYDIESGCTGIIKQLSDTKTPFNTVLMDNNGKILLWSFDFGEYNNQLSIETTALNNIFTLPQMIQSSNIGTIVSVIKSNQKFSKMKEYYRDYLKTGNNTKHVFYIKFRDSILLDLIDSNVDNKLF